MPGYRLNMPQAGAGANRATPRCLVRAATSWANNPPMDTPKINRCELGM